MATVYLPEHAGRESDEHRPEIDQKVTPGMDSNP